MQTPKGLGFSRDAFAARCRVRPATISDNANGRPGKVNVLWAPLMDALKRLSPEQRAEWLAEGMDRPGSVDPPA